MQPPPAKISPAPHATPATCGWLQRSRPAARSRRRALRALRAQPLAVQLLLATVGVTALWFAANAAYQVVRKPSELFFPVSGALSKAPAETWRQYAPTFRANATAVITPTLLAGLAQVEGAGNPVAAQPFWPMTASSTSHSPALRCALEAMPPSMPDVLTTVAAEALPQLIAEAAGVARRVLAPVPDEDARHQAVVTEPSSTSPPPSCRPGTFRHAARPSPWHRSDLRAKDRRSERPPGHVQPPPVSISFAWHATPACPAWLQRILQVIPLASAFTTPWVTVEARSPLSRTPNVATPARSKAQKIARLISPSPCERVGMYSRRPSSVKRAPSTAPRRERLETTSRSRSVLASRSRAGPRGMTKASPAETRRAARPRREVSPRPQARR